MTTRCTTRQGGIEDCGSEDGEIELAGTRRRFTRRRLTMNGRNRQVQRAAGTAALISGGVFAAGALTILGGLVREALGADPAVDDGPDDLLAPPQKAPRRDTVTTADGARLNVLTYRPDSARDTGDILVLVHGWTCNTSHWNPQVNNLSATRTIVTCDLRGHGASTLGRRRATIGLLGRDLNAVLDAVVPNDRRAVLVGHSMGGMAIMSWAGQFPGKVTEKASAVVLASTAARGLLTNHLLIPAGLPGYTRVAESTVSRVATGTPLPLPRNNIYGRRFVHHLALGPHARSAHVDFVEDMITSCRPFTRAAWGAAMGSVDLGGGLTNLTVPTTVIVGSADRLTPRTHAAEISEVLRRTGHLRELLVLDGVGHMSTIEAAEQVTAVIEQVLDQPSTIPAKGPGMKAGRIDVAD